MAGRRIIICCDGTWNVLEPRDASAPTNVAKFYRALDSRDSTGAKQLALYMPGIGTAGLWDFWVGGHTGLGLDAKVLDAYRWLHETWRDGDVLYLVGFSRGSFVVQTLANFLGQVGLLSDQQMLEAWGLFVQGRLQPDSVSLPIQMIAVWDTVDALGLPVPGLRALSSPKLPPLSSQLGVHIKNGFHALAIDEIRSAFKPQLWSNDPLADQRIEQVWFAGVHADCGGGYPEAGLSDVSLHWMIQRAMECGLAFDPEYRRREIHPDPKQPLHKERKWLHLLLPVYHRSLRSANPNTEWIHWSAVDRFNDPAAGYKPENLREALLGGGVHLVTDPCEDATD